MSDSQVEISVVMPCFNEEETVATCVSKALQAFYELGIQGEVVVCDNSSTDESASVAEAAGARVVPEAVPGYGSALMTGIAASRGKYIIMGDADDTYDFHEIASFVTYLRQGYDLVMGSRFKGKILPGAMSWSHRYIGNPILSGILNLLFNTNISDSHCGMRGFTQEAYKKLNLNSSGMEFASEMVFKASRAKLKMADVPINYYPRKGSSKLNTVQDAWRHLRLMLMYSPTWLYLIPGGASLLIGLALLVFASKVPLIFFGGLFMLLGLQVISLGLHARTFGHIVQFYEGDRFMEWLWKHFDLEKGIMLGIIGLVAGAVIFTLAWKNWQNGVAESLRDIKSLVFGMTLFIGGVHTIFSSFFLSMMGMSRKS